MSKWATKGSPHTAVAVAVGPRKAAVAVSNKKCHCKSQIKTVDEDVVKLKRIFTFASEEIFERKITELLGIKQILKDKS